ncbi:hypothetical protein [Ruminococcus albus]|uniref:Uncharacterized protein n=1 Tax=Ruminococcus albus TaxID=1264 RepID=A0A1H7FAW0_RUMAL|nr:hypothetical protein [Ruminococcus albus]SEK22477.1 hypothetical protein SAMN05216469_101164 [Ruminococcus albus]
MRLKDINIFCRSDDKQEDTKLVRSESAHVADMFVKLMRYYENDSCKMLNICMDAFADSESLEQQESFPILHIPFDNCSYLSLDNSEKSSFWLRTIMDAVQFYGGERGWDMSFFERVKKQIAESGFVNHFRYGKYVTSPDKKHKAAVEVEQSINCAKLYLVIYKGRKELCRMRYASSSAPW